jgi:hypothetical protein
MAEKAIPVLELKRPVTNQELAERGGWTPRYIDLEVARGRLKKRCSGRASRFLPCDIQEWLDRRASEVAK